MSGILQAAGLSGVTLLVVAAIAWLAVRSINAGLDRAKSDLESRLRQSDMAFSNGLNSRVELDLDLRQKRDALYRSLWPETQVLSLTPINKSLKYADVMQLSLTLRDWYFAECGGLYLSETAQSAYRDAQTALAQATTRDPAELVWQLPDGKEYEVLRLALSTLRTALTIDLQSRTPGPSI